MHLKESLRPALSYLGVAHQIETLMNAERKRLGLNATQMLVLAEMSMALGRGRLGRQYLPMTATDLGVTLHMSQQAISAQLTRMGELGLVEKVSAEQPMLLDGRIQPYGLTVAGVTKAKEARKLLGQVAAVIRIGLGKSTAQMVDEANATASKHLVQCGPLDHDLAAEHYLHEVLSEKRADARIRAKVSS